MNASETTENENSASSAAVKNSDDKKYEIDDIDLKEIKKNIPPDFDTWTECKKQAWQHLDDNPNTFFYRHVLPGETKKNGLWSEDEKVLFLKVFKEHPPVKGHWGLFSRYIPSRVGYQCNSFYKKLVSTGEIEEIIAINKKSSNSNNNNISSSNSNTNITNNIQDTNTKIQINSKKKVIMSKSSNSSRLQSIISYLYLPRKSLFDDYNISLISRRPAQNSEQTNTIHPDESEYAYNNALIQSVKDDFIIDPKNETKQSFHDMLAENLNDPTSEAKFKKFSYEYFKFE